MSEDDLVDALKDLRRTVSKLAQRLQDIRDDLEATVEDCDTMAKAIDDLREATDE
jgi:regulator of replication initiation timing